MVLLCCVKSCVNSKKKTKVKINKLHSFPKDPSLRKEWLTNCNRLDLQEKSLCYFRVCCKHFTAKMYGNPENTILLPTAVPTKFGKEGPTTVKEEPTTVKEEPTTIKEEPTTVKEEPTTVKEEPTTVEEEHELDQSTALNISVYNASLEVPVIMNKPRKSNSPLLETCILSTSKVCSETSSAMITQTTQLLTVHTPCEKNIKTHICKVKEKCKQLEEIMNSNSNQKSEMFKPIDHFSEIVDSHLDILSQFLK